MPDKINKDDLDNLRDKLKKNVYKINRTSIMLLSFYAVYEYSRSFHRLPSESKVLVMRNYFLDMCKAWGIEYEGGIDELDNEFVTLFHFTKLIK